MINFLDAKHRQATKQQNQDKRLFQFSLIGFIVVVLAVLALGSLTLGFNYQIDQAEAKTEQLEQEILANQEVEKSAVVLAKKVSILKELLDERQNKQQAIEFFRTLFGDTVILKDVNYKSEAGILSLRVEAASVFELEQLVLRLRNPETVKAYTDVVVSELSRDDQGAYFVTVTIPLASNELPKPGADQE